MVTAGDRQALGLVTTACAAVAGAVGADEGAAFEEAAFGDLLATAARTRALPVVAWHIYERGIARPDWFQEVAFACFGQFNERNERFASEAARLAAALMDAGISMAFRKGAHVCHLYPRLGVRPFSDLDLLVNATDVQRLPPVMEALGYVPVQLTREQRAFLTVATNATPGYRLDGGPRSLLVDISSSLLLPVMADRWSSGDLLGFDDVDRDEIAGSGGALPVLALPYLLLDLVVNLYIGATTMQYVNRLRFQRITPYMDVLNVAGRLTADGWATFRHCVERLHLEPAVTFAFGNGERLFGGGLFDAHWPGASDATLLDEYGEFEFGAPQRWPMTVDERMLIERLPASVPQWASPI